MPHYNRVPSRRFQLAIGVAFLSTLALTLLLYLPGLSGSFIFDDLPNLERLDGINQAPGLESLLLYIGSGGSSIIGRPISLLSFAAQAHAWPSDPAAFKLVNIFIHLLNGSLIFVLTRQLGTQLSPSTRERTLAALLVSAVWLIHPLHVSSVLFVVQRMNQLAVLFTLAGLICYVHGRQQLAADKLRTAYTWMSLGIVAGIGLGVLSKESGILLPLFALVLEVTLFASLPRPRGYRMWSTVFLVGPPAALVGHMLLNFHGYFVANYSHRDFSVYERVLTQSRVLLEYIGKVFAPRPSELHLFYDDYLVSRGLLDPPATLLAVIVVIALLMAAILARRRSPIFAFGLLWFFAGHVLESTVIALELVFDHRNYLPSVGLIFAAVWAALKLASYLRSRLSRAAALGAAATLLALLTLATAHQAQLWGNPFAQAAVWASERPNSLRSQEWHATMAMLAGNREEALRTLEHMARIAPTDASPLVSTVRLACTDPEVPLPSLQQLRERAAGGSLSNGVIRGTNSILELKLEERCARVPDALLEGLLLTLIENPSYHSELGSLHFLLGKTYAQAGVSDKAFEQMELAFSHKRRHEIALILAGWAIDEGRYSAARNYVSLARQATERNPVLATALKLTFEDWDRIIQAHENGTSEANLEMNESAAPQTHAEPTATSE